jgi:RNA polymerase sigma factor (sigma-70 family)
MSTSPLRHPARVAGASLLRLQTDDRLADLAVSGHEAAFDAIVDRYRAPLTRYCAGITGPSRAEDAVQQALINAHDALKRTDEVRHLRSWLYRIAHNASLNVLRAVRDDVPLDDVSLPAAAVDASSGPAEAFERSERFRATVAALNELPERQRAALVLRELEGRSHQEIADALGVTKGSARQHLMRARVALRGAVTAVTPYPLIARLAETLAGPASSGWVETAASAGAGATLAKLATGLAATGALVGGAVGTQQVIGDRSTPVPREARPAPRQTAGAPARVVVRQASSIPPTAAPASASASPPARSRSPRGSDRDRPHRSSSKPGGSAPRPAVIAPPTGTDDDATTPSSSVDHGRGHGADDDDNEGSSPSSANRGHGNSGAGSPSKAERKSKSKSQGNSGKHDTSSSDSAGQDRGGDEKPASPGKSGKDKPDDSSGGSDTTTPPPAPAPVTITPTDVTGGGDDSTAPSDADPQTTAASDDDD